MLPAAWSSLGPRGGSMTASHLTQVTQAQGREGGQVLWWELGQTFLFAAVTCDLYLVSGPAQAQDKIHKKSSRSIDDYHLMSL